VPFKLVPIGVITGKPYQNQWLIKGYIEKNNIGMIFGAPASAKSFIAMDMAFCTGAGINWNGNKTEQGNVVYLAGEGHNGIGKRFKALEEKYGIKASNVYISDIPASLIDSSNAIDVANAILGICKDASLIIIDTLHRNLGSGDENSAKDMATFISNLDGALKLTGATILIIHHSGHGSTDRGRGSSSLKGALDVEYHVEKKGDLVTMLCTKMKEYEKPDPTSFNLVSQPVAGWFDSDGEPIESAILQSTTYTVPVRQSRLTKRDSLILQALISRSDLSGIIAPESATKIHAELAREKYLHDDDWRSEVYCLLDRSDPTNMSSPQAKQKAFLRSKEKLLKANKIAEHNDHYWAVD
jgi:hypothetical protein